MCVPMAIPNSLDQNRRIWVFKASPQRLKTSYSGRYKFYYLLVEILLKLGVDINIYRIIF